MLSASPCCIIITEIEVNFMLFVFCCFWNWFYSRNKIRKLFFPCWLNFQNIIFLFFSSLNKVSTLVLLYDDQEIYYHRQEPCFLFPTLSFANKLFPSSFFLFFNIDSFFPLHSFFSVEIFLCYIFCCCCCCFLAYALKKVQTLNNKLKVRSTIYHVSFNIT